ncbi:MAG: translocation/assembly module TamB domain-containing protein, partial [Vicinamibacterales bacterium]
ELRLPTLAVRTQGIEWKTASGSTPTIDYGGNRVQIQDLRLVSGNQSLSVSGAFSMGDNPQLGGVTVQAKNVDIAQIEQLAMQNRGFTGTLNANATLAGSLKAPAVKGHIDVANGGFEQFKYQSFTLDAGYEADRATVNAKLVQSPGAQLTVTGAAPMSAFKSGTAAAHGAGMDLHIQSSPINLSIIQGFTDQVTNVTGTLQTDVHVTGVVSDPRLNGYVDIEKGGFGLVAAGTKFSGLSSRIELLPDRIHVPRFQILDAHGSALTIQGDLAFRAAQGGAVDVSMESNDFKLLDNDLGKLSVDTDLHLTGEVRRPRVEGTVKLTTARLNLDEIFDQFASPYSTQQLPDVVSAEDATFGVTKGGPQGTRQAQTAGQHVAATTPSTPNPAGAQTPAPQTGVMSALALNVHLVASDNLIVRGDNLRPGGATAANVGNMNMTIGTNVQIEKAVDGPIEIRGTARTVRGFYEFEGRRFTVDRGGTVRFIGGPEMNPNVDVTAERLIPNTGVTAKIHVTGTVQK